MPSDLPLVLRYPRLAAIPRERFVDVPTPVEPLRLGGVPDGALLVKRDDGLCRLYGGNKPRKLEFILGEACRRRATRLVTTGGVGTHHGLATALLARELGLSTTVVVVDQPITAHVRDQQRRLQESGARIVYAGRPARAAVAVARELATARLHGERPMLVATGGSSAIGVLGFVAAGVEIAEQIASGQAPRPAAIHVPVGSGGTLAGLVLGLRLAGLSLPVLGVVVTDLLAPSPRRLARLARAALVRLRRVEPALPDDSPEPRDFALTTTQLGGGYGVPTPQAEQTARAALEQGLRLETVYSAKCLAESWARAREPRGSQPILFWNTFDGQSPASGERDGPADATGEPR